MTAQLKRGQAGNVSERDSIGKQGIAQAGAGNGRLYLLIVEDSEDDAVLLVRTLERQGYNIEHMRVHGRNPMKSALRRKSWDAIVADYVIPGFGAIPALKLLQEMGLDIPFLIVSGVMGEEQAVEAMRAGAHDYLLKSRLTRLGPAIEREIKEAAVRRARKEAEAALKKSTADLAAQKTKLEHKNIALQEILEQIEIEKNRIRTDIAKNLERTVIPVLRRLNSRTDETGRREIELLHGSLRNLASDQDIKLAAALSALSPRQFEICNLIRGGMTSSKDIASSLSISPRTVETQRNVIRKKLGLRGKGMNLATHLKTLR